MTKRVVPATMVAALLVSLGVNVVLLRRLTESRRTLYRTRFDPLGATAYPSQIDAALPQPVVVFLGDSRSEAWPNPPTTTPTIFVNRGIGGQTSVQVSQRFAMHVAPLQPDVIVLQVGVNDLGTLPLFPAQRDEIVALCKQSIDAIIAQSREISATVVLTTIFARGPLSPLQWRAWSNDIDTAISEVNAHIVARAADDVLVFDSAALLSDEHGFTRGNYSDDYLHLSEDGYAVLNAALVPVLAQAMK